MSPQMPVSVGITLGIMMLLLLLLLAGLLWAYINLSKLHFEMLGASLDRTADLVVAQTKIVDLETELQALKRGQGNR